jgi:hypothetical protein
MGAIERDVIVGPDAILALAQEEVTTEKEKKWVAYLMTFRVAWLARCRGVRFSGTSRAGFLALLLCQLWGLCQHGRPAHRDNSFATANSRLAVPMVPCAAGKELAKTTAVLQHIRAAQRRAASLGTRAPLPASV